MKHLGTIVMAVIAVIAYSTNARVEGTLLQPNFYA